MPSTCARCGVPDADRKLYPPGEWVRYLVDERGLAPVEGVLAIPLCRNCNGRVVPIQQAYRELDSLETDRRATVRERVHATLDSLDLDALADETESLR